MLCLCAARRGVPLSYLGTLDLGSLALAINHQSQFPSTTLSFISRRAPHPRPCRRGDSPVESSIGMPASVKAGFQGTAQAFADSRSSW